MAALQTAIYAADSASYRFHANVELAPSDAQTSGAEIDAALPKGTHALEWSVASGFGLSLLTTQINHDMALASVRYGRTVTRTFGESDWYGGHVEILGELFGGGQYRPNNAYIVGLAPVLRYVFTPGERWSPFIEGSFGPTLTDIGRPDLSTTFEFTSQGGFGLRYLWNKHQAISVQGRYLHMSNGGIEKPNRGVNAFLVMVGTGWYF